MRPPIPPILPIPPIPRFERVDALRGVAVLWMTLYHLAYDLQYFGYWQQNFHSEPLWTLQRSAIVSAFLFCAGVSQAIALQQGQSWARFWRRWAQVAGCALLVSMASYLVFPRSFIYFGVLHGLAVMLLIARCTAHWGAWLWPLGALAIGSAWAVPALWAQTPLAELWNAAPLNVFGWVSRKPFTEDYVPLFPWLGVLLWGVASGRWLLLHRPELLARPLPRMAALPVWLGRWSLAWYMLHQPLLMGAFMAWAWWLGLTSI